MSKEIWKLGYCSICNKNVPHCRKKAKGFRETVCELLQKLQLGRWHCLHCQRTRYFLPFVDEDAIDYRVVGSNDPVDQGKLEVWSRSASNVGDVDLNGGSGPVNSMVEFQDQQSASGIANETWGAVDAGRDVLGESWGDQFGLREENVLNHDFDEEFSRDERETERDVAVASSGSNDRDSIDAAISLVVGEAGHLVSCESPQSSTEQGQEVVEAEPVGNFIKDQSLALKATRLKRFTEKYRDALVDRILSGKAQISSLTADGKYTEAELVSWIADKVRRETHEVETIDLDVVPRKSK